MKFLSTPPLIQRRLTATQVIRRSLLSTLIYLRPRALIRLGAGSRAAALFLLFAWVGATAAEKIDINTAPLEDLIKIIHIGEIRAKELISLRPFSSLDELIMIKGIGEARLQDIKEQGLAYVARTEDRVNTDEELSGIGYKTEAHPTAVIINEILASPEGADETEERIEIFNQSDFEVNLSDWKIADAVGKTTTYTFPPETKIVAQGFLVLSRPETKIALNNDGDKIILFGPDGKVLDEVSYEKALLGQSYNRTDESWAWSNSPTLGSANVVPEPTTPKAEDKKGKEGSSKDLATISQSFRQAQAKQAPKVFPAPLIAFALSIFSGTIILFLKRRIKVLDKLQ